MSIFGKKEDQFEEEENLEEGRKITRNLKDLKSENKKKRKEPPKPWGKKERWLILLVLLATTIASAILLFTSSFEFKSEKPKISAPKFNFNSINIFKGETIVIEKK
ncbi:MAG: hypothetical protein UU51_C0027G0006 [Microgenomates group bacterium GW2011_GWC1_41_20]|uniref:Uncharacterized protein n=7 Tax=Candidatus Woeseibacteriota TaxID=1752722 RepID=A0A0G0RTV9_9BACT|nr:MAG: hypothetical protein UT76_C0026G0004 [Candidatus Woesebacteria bacterium GW2011_GWB1_40_12]KKR55973.1 MAG: hypothetical protein UT93_C0009G0016 [Candidatus Woesebacteria bacterium GW2011_GWF1_40_24]KKR90929.1 MAG: hypothetical protein UU39_C0004G0014 [Candidatus Woesebacteria bacterium GW2011_GWD1_41_12]KKR99442.1 MAG: hypothetical protein UU51_C0027G0006 [Microgenomates group bacterium GW2011_GWC1_41_20]KKS04053.1 MAG: hypothetical protein UU57_C0025G0006 [Candidatus Woesebacteria bact